MESWETFCIILLTPLLFVLKCKSCLKHFCSKCQRQENENIVKSGTCDQCDIKVLRTLQEICRSNIRRTIKGAIGAAGSSADMLQSGDIDQSVQHLPLPGPVKNYVCYKWDLPSPTLPKEWEGKRDKKLSYKIYICDNWKGQMFEFQWYSQRIDKFSMNYWLVELLTIRQWKIIIILMWKILNNVAIFSQLVVYNLEVDCS